MNVEKKKEMIIKLAEELQEELGEDEKLLLVCSFDEQEHERLGLVMHSSINHIFSVLRFICKNSGVSVNEFNSLLDFNKSLYINDWQEEGDE